MPFFFLEAVTGDSWPIDDPVSWCLGNVHHPTLGRAREGLLRLAAADGDRVIRLVTRRCGLNLLEVRPGRVVVHH